MGFGRFWLTMADKTIKVHRRVIRKVFPMIQRAENDRSVRRALPVYDNAISVLKIDIKVQMTKIYIPVSSLQILRHCFKDHNAENRIQKFQLIPEL